MNQEHKQCCKLNSEYFKQFSDGKNDPNIVIITWRIHAQQLKEICPTCKESIKELEDIYIIRP